MELDAARARARDLQARLEEATTAQREVARELRALVTALRSTGLTVREVAALIDRSPTRVAQLTKETAR